MPRNGFSFAVLIGSQPNHIGCFYLFFQFGNQFLFIRRNFILWSVIVLKINSQSFLSKIANMSHAGRNFKIFSEKLFNSLCLGRRLYNH